jgi:tetratricopeptide (TPR) repeat protein
LSRSYPIYLSLALTTLLILFGIGSVSAASSGRIDTPDTAPEGQVCDPAADYYLGMEDYPKAVELHEALIQRHPGRALAYYHLGFAYGILGNHDRELMNYQKAVELGLSDWGLFLNLGRLYLENDRPDQASDAFRLAALLGPYRPETHYNLGLVYERLGALQKAEQEILLSLRLDRDQIDARNTLAVIYAEEGNYEQAHREWADLHRSYPDYGPARANLDVLQRVEHGQIKSTTRLGGFAKAP